MPSTQSQGEIFADPEQVKEVEEVLGVTDGDLEGIPKVSVAEKHQPKEAIDITMDTYALMSGSLEDKTLQLKVVSVFDLSTAHDIPDPELLDSEMDVWRHHLLSYIVNNDEMLKKALFLLVRG